MQVSWNMFGPDVRPAVAAHAVRVPPDRLPVFWLGTPGAPACDPHTGSVPWRARRCGPVRAGYPERGGSGICAAGPALGRPPATRILAAVTPSGGRGWRMILPRNVCRNKTVAWPFRSHPARICPAVRVRTISEMPVVMTDAYRLWPVRDTPVARRPAGRVWPKTGRTNGVRAGAKSYKKRYEIRDPDPAMRLHLSCWVEGSAYRPGCRPPVVRRP